MSLFNESEITAAKEQIIRDRLRQNGLGHLSVKVRRKSGTDDDIILTGGSEDDIKRAESVLGGTAIISQSGFISDHTIKTPTIDETIIGNRRKKNK